ncbi:Spy/CpxP family protein refolding chaperone [Polyangium aurulentum]|uniref:Spy/CpxP family protein refolding chaperone n=1 Tax=Polyangium aurulentum TaxID=2567896 RepID=UPI0010AEA4AA|nr:periplasmic heavy metal sensor [Polyangium aurulentum]UQA57726.1 periplasmic heavy metal sensor [Polyangium aurulentum]
MFGFIIGTVCLIGLIKTLRGGGCGGGWGRRGYGYGGGCGGGRFGGGYGYGGGHGGWEEGEGGEHGHHGGPFRTHGRAWGWGRGGGGGGGMRSFFMRRLFEHLDTTPGQEKAIAAAVDELRGAMREHRGEVQKTRADIARAMRGANFDEVVLGELFARHDTAIEAMRKATVGALGRVHEALDERQRARLADLLEQYPGFFGGPFGGRGVEI